MKANPFEQGELSIRENEDRASKQYPSIPVEGCALHVFGLEGGWQVWLNTEVQDFDGLCIGTGTSRNGAIAEARKVLEACVEVLQTLPVVVSSRRDTPLDVVVGGLKQHKG